VSTLFALGGAVSDQERESGVPSRGSRADQHRRRGAVIAALGSGRHGRTMAAHLAGALGCPCGRCCTISLITSGAQRVGPRRGIRPCGCSGRTPAAAGNRDRPCRAALPPRCHSRLHVLDFLAALFLRGRRGVETSCCSSQPIGDDGSIAGEENAAACAMNSIDVTVCCFAGSSTPPSSRMFAARRWSDGRGGGARRGPRNRGQGRTRGRARRLSPPTITGCFQPLTP